MCEGIAVTKPHRIAAGGIVIHNDTILLVRYADADDSPFLAGPGGALETNENISQAIVREVKEETGVIVRPDKVLWIENMECISYKMCKIWMLCDLVSNDLLATNEAEQEGIVEVGWFSRAELAGEQVFPSIICDYDWDLFSSASWSVGCPPCRDALI